MHLMFVPFSQVVSHVSARTSQWVMVGNWYFSLCVHQSCGPDLILSASSVQSDTKAESGLSAGKWGERVGCELTFHRTFWDQVSKKTGSGFIRFLTVSTRSKSFQKCVQVPSNNSSLLNCFVLFLFVFFKFIWTVCNGSPSTIINCKK